MSSSKSKCCNGYVPKPLDTSDTVIPKRLEPCLDALARNTHEVWAQGRIAQGWRYGEPYSLERREHPDLVPYEQLTEEEKLFDINTSREVIKALLKMGYDIVVK